jgi:hypothetical protein
MPARASWHNFTLLRDCKAWLFTWALLPETSGRTLDEVQEIWRERAAVLFRHHHTQKSKAQ